MGGVGSLKITLTPNPKNGIFIDIKDTGKGMSAKVQRKIFNPGFSTKKRGWGLGLTLAKRIIEVYHSGEIFVKESSPNSGTTFRVVL